LLSYNTDTLDVWRRSSSTSTGGHL